MNTNKHVHIWPLEGPKCESVSLIDARIYIKTDDMTGTYNHSLHVRKKEPRKKIY